MTQFLITSNRHGQKIGLYFLVAFAFFIPLNIVGTNIAVSLTCLIILFSGRWAQKWAVLKHNKTLWFLGLFWLLIFIGLFYSPSPWHERLYDFRKMSKLLYIPFLLLLLPKAAWRRNIVYGFLGGASIVAIVGFYNHFIKHSGDPLSTFNQHIWAGFILAMAGVIVLCRCFSEKYRWLWIIGFMLIVYLIFFLNIGRAGMLGLLIGSLYVLWRKLSLKTFSISLVLIILSLSVITGFKIGELGNRLHRTGTNLVHRHQRPDTSIAVHTLFLTTGIKLILEKPFIGHGTGSFITVYHDKFGIPPGWGSDKLGNPENTYMNIGVQLGLVGLLLFFYILFRLYRDAGAIPGEGLEYQAMLVVFMACATADSFIKLSPGGFSFILLNLLILSAHHETKKKISAA
jgi:O-antigen ligase